MTGRILHISDLHVSRLETPEPLAALAELVPDLAPDLLVATGDLTHRGRTAELEHAKSLLESLSTPFFAVPGNHDIPYVLSRFTTPFAKWTRTFGALEPVHSSDSLVLHGLTSVRPWRQQGGSVELTAIERVRSTFSDGPKGALRVVAFHHHLASPPWRAPGKNPVQNRDLVLRALVNAGAELVIGGHVHQATVVERREFEVLDEAHAGSIVLATVPGFGRPRPRRRGEAVGFNVYEWDESELTAHSWTWVGSGFERVGVRTFRRG